MASDGKIICYLFNNLNINNNEKLPNSIKFGKVGSKIWLILDLPSKMVKDLNFAKSVHTAVNTVVCGKWL